MVDEELELRGVLEALAGVGLAVGGHLAGELRHLLEGLGRVAAALEVRPSRLAAAAASCAMSTAMPTSSASSLSSACT